MGTTITATAGELRSIALAATDRRGYFAAMYARVTRRVASAIDDGRFADGARMDEFASAFAAYYLQPLRGEVPAPRCWTAAWDVAEDRKLLIVQHLLLGINAHVNHDLALTVVEVAGLRGDIGSIRPDFNAVNDVLVETYDELLADLGLVSRWAARASGLGGADAFNFSLRVAREQAWRAAVAMHTLDDMGLRTYQAELDRLVTVLAHQIATPPRWVRPLVWLARRFEDSDAAAVTRHLLGPDA
jgi:hypothetical protein